MAIGATSHRVTVMGMVLAAAACGNPGPRPLAFGEQECAQCHMTLADPRFAGQLVTVTGKVIPFDDVGCLATFIATGGLAAADRHSVWFQDFAQPDSLLEASRAVFLRQDSVPTPMDHGILALRAGASADSIRRTLGGELLTWDQVVDLKRARDSR